MADSEEFKDNKIWNPADLFARVQALGFEDFYCYRGHADSDWELIPKLYRRVHNLKQDDSMEAHENRLNVVERRLYDDFRERLPTYHFRDYHDSPWELVSLAQHYGAPTRLLDWSSNPLVAAFFAVIDPSHDKVDGAICAINVSYIVMRENPKERGEFPTSKRAAMRGQRLKDLSTDLECFVNFQRQGGEDGFCIIQPPDIDGRMKSQSGLFTVFIGDEFVWNHHYEYLPKGNIYTGYYQKWTIPKDAKPFFRKNLNLLGVNYNSLFPDLSGLGSYMMTLEELWYDLEKGMG